MATEFSLELATDLSPTQATRLLAEQLRLRRVDETHLLGPALELSALAVSSGWWSADIEEGFHFSPNLSVSFRLDSNSEDYAEGYRVMLRATLLLLGHGRDAVLLFNGELIVLQRLAGQLVLNEDYRLWRDGHHLEEEVTLPHEIRPLPSPLLRT